MNRTQYRDAVVQNRRKHGFEPVDEYTDGFDPVWEARDEDDSIGRVRILATLVDDEPDPSPEDLAATADAFRDVLVDRATDRYGSTTPLGYVVFPVSDPDSSLVRAAHSYTVARRRTNVFPLVYDCEAETLYRHDIPRLKGRGIYRRQAEDAERLFEV
ncbi:hypothetical protein U4E84_11755 [Halorubrum sp. AD140]|uniref:hypothetical protein n=1 Tax=Halorubrum sp. AD140 TaxID=3050073 RepID=UPI002ACC5C69|nr:hypothetical protein [Halorubrum sp. AD140]MDZ5812017.1 hypothetical protein [Halorubrum sp. AD140]